MALVLPKLLVYGGKWAYRVERRASISASCAITGTDAPREVFCPNRASAMIRTLVMTAAFGLCLIRIAAAAASGNATSGRCSAVPAGATPGTPSVVASGGLRLRYFGASSVLISDSEGWSILVDGFFSRPSVSRLIIGAEPDPRRIASGVALMGDAKVLAILVAHAHHDHAMDAGAVADALASRPRAGGCPAVHGSPGAARIASAGGRRCTDFQTLQDDHPMCIGPFEVRALSTPHTESPLNLPGAVSRNFSFPAQLFDFKLDGNFSFFVAHAQGRVLIVPSAGLRPAGYPGIEADTVLLGVGGIGGWIGRREALLRDLWTQAVEATAARLVVPIHWDDMTEPLVDKNGVARLFPAPRYLGDIEWTMKLLNALARAGNKQVLIAPAANEVALPTRRQ